MTPGELQSDIRILSARLFHLPLKLRAPLRFGSAPARDLSSLLIELEVENRGGNRGRGRGEVPLNVQWLWPDSDASSAERTKILLNAARATARELIGYRGFGNPVEIALAWTGTPLTIAPPGVPAAAAAAVFAAFDIAVHDAWGVVNGRDAYDCYGDDLLGRDLSDIFAEAGVDFPAGRGRRPADYLRSVPAQSLPAWHMVGGEDYLTGGEVPAGIEDDGYPRSLDEWLIRDGIRLVKIKLFGSDPDWDYNRVVEIGRIGISRGVERLSVDFNCTVSEEEYLKTLLVRLEREEPRIFEMLLFVEQPFPADASIYDRDVAALSALKPLFLDEAVSGPAGIAELKRLGWSGLALKSCKGQTASVLTACLAVELGMPLMVQDLTNPRLAMISHAALAARVPTIMGLETNACQFYPDESAPEAAIHPGLFRRRNGSITTGSIRGPGIGYRWNEIARPLPEPAFEYGRNGLLQELSR